VGAAAARYFRILAAPEILPPGKIRVNLFLPSPIPVFDFVEDTAPRHNQAFGLLLLSTFRTLAASKILRLGIIKPLACFCSQLFVL
jgi:hypothetical protein